MGKSTLNSLMVTLKKQETHLDYNKDMSLDSDVKFYFTFQQYAT